MTGEFMREDRYIVFKLSDLGNSLKGDEIRRLAREYAEQRRLKGKKPLECVVVEKDWPEYEPMWKAIEARVTGALYESAVQVAARIMNQELIAERDALRIENEALRAEVAHVKEVEFPRKAQAVADGWRGKCERLKAKIEVMERQEPVAWMHPSGGVLRTLGTGLEKETYTIPLYALPGAQGEEK